MEKEYCTIGARLTRLEDRVSVCVWGGGGGEVFGGIGGWVVRVSD